MLMQGVDAAGGPDGPTTLTVTRQFTTNCTSSEAAAQWVRSLSFDAARGHLLVMSGNKQHDDDSSFSLLDAPACHECTNNASDTRRYFVDAQTSPPSFTVSPLPLPCTFTVQQTD